MIQYNKYVGANMIELRSRIWRVCSKETNLLVQWTCKVLDPPAHQKSNKAQNMLRLIRTVALARIVRSVHVKTKQ